MIAKSPACPGSRRFARLGTLGGTPLWPALFSCLAALFPAAAASVEIDSVMYRDPILKKPSTEVRLVPGQIDLWLEALERPERDLNRKAAAAIARAHAKGYPGLDVAVDPLVKLLKRADGDPVLRRTAAGALVVLDARRTAPVLLKQSPPGDLDMAELVEPAFARWKHVPARDLWRKRLAGNVGLRQMHVLAIRGLAALGATEAVPRLSQLAEDSHTPAGVRLEAAAALGRLQATGLESSARKLMESKSAAAVVDRLVASRMLRSHRGKEAEGLLLELATDPQPSVRAVALEHLLDVDPDLIVPVIEETIGSGDANVRRLGARALVAKPSPEKLDLLGPMLDDPHPDLRRYVCDSLVELAEDASLEEEVIGQGRRMLASDGWRAQEQAALLLVTLDQKTIVDRLLELLDADRPEVRVTAAWGLCRLAVPSTAEPILEALRTRTQSALDGEIPPEGTGDQLSHLAQALGRLKHTPADSVLRKYVPKSAPFGTTSRVAAIWALGHFHADGVDSELASQLQGRLLDYDSDQPEDFAVRRMAAVTLGRMKATDVLPTLREMLAMEGIASEVGYACAWAIHRLTGEEIPEVEPSIGWDTGWFLVPVPGQ